MLIKCMNGDNMHAVVWFSLNIRFICMVLSDLYLQTVKDV